MKGGFPPWSEIELVVAVVAKGQIGEKRGERGLSPANNTSFWLI